MAEITVNAIKESAKYKPGDRIALVFTDDPWTQLRPGAEGTVTHVDDAGTVHICWDFGEHVGMAPDPIPPWVAPGPSGRVDEIRKVDGPPAFCSRCQHGQDLIARLAR